VDRKSIEAIYPLSPMQRGMLFHSLYAPGARAYFEQQTYAVEGALDLPSFVGAWQRVLDRHAILRSQFVWNQRHEPLQLVRRRIPVPWSAHDCRGLSPSELEARLDAIRRADADQGFDLASAPLTRLTLIRAEEQRAYLIWSFHHALLDRWSVSVILSEVSHLYEALVRRSEPSLGPSPVYQNYVKWCLGQNQSRARAFWTRTLEGFTSPVTLSAQHASATVSTPRYRQHRISLSPEATSTLRDFVRSNQMTLNTLIQGAWALVLGRNTGADDVVHGVTVTSRPAELAHVDAMVGCLINTLPVRIRVPPDESVLSWLRAIQARLLELREYEFSSLVDIQGWSQVPRGLPLFESIVVFENIPIQKQAPAERSVEIRMISATEPRTGYPLTVVGVPDRELSLIIIYDAGRFEEPAIARLLRQLETGLEWLAAAPEQPLSALPVDHHQGARVGSAAPDRSEARTAAAAPTFPRTATEVALAGIWSEVLGVKTVRREDDFFALGGHSLRAMQVAARVRDTFDLELPLATIFEAPILAQLAQRIEAAGGIGSGEPPVPPLRPREGLSPTDRDPRPVLDDGPHQ
jgi:acyl carrier protein